MDVSTHCGVFATRFADVLGTETSLVLRIARKVRETLLSSHRFTLAGLDIMEIDVYKLGAKLKDGIEDETQNFIQDYMALLCGNGSGGAQDGKGKLMEKQEGTSFRELVAIMGRGKCE